MSNMFTVLTVVHSIETMLHNNKHPNCTLYLIWHYLQRGNVDAAASEYVRDSDKLGSNRQLVGDLLKKLGADI